MGKTYHVDRSGTLHAFGPNGQHLRLPVANIMVGPRPVDPDNAVELLYAYSFVVLADVLGEQTTARAMVWAFQNEVTSKLGVRPWWLEEVEILKWLQSRLVARH